jgi:hypothetical protein
MPPTDAARLRLLAAEALAIAAGMTDIDSKQVMAEVAAGYERLADHAERRETAASPLGTASLSDSQCGASRGTRRALRS